MVAMTLFIGPLQGGLVPVMSKCSSPSRLGHGHLDDERLVDHAIGIDDGAAAIRAVGYGLYAGAHLLRGATAKLSNCGLHSFRTIAIDQCGQPLGTDVECRRLRFDVADPLISDPNVREYDGEDFFIHLAGFDQLDRRQAQAFLLDLGGVRRESTRHHAADVGPVPGVGQPGE